MIVITGASNGLGKFLLEKFRAKGYSVIGTYNSTYLNIEGLSKVDITDYEQVSSWLNKQTAELNNIILINCAGISYNSFAHKADCLKWRKVFEVNVFGTFNVIRYLLPLMRSQKYGRIINFSSVVAQKPTPGISAYASSKAALTGLTKSISAEVGKLNITINNINLGYVNIGMGIEEVPKGFKEKIKSEIPSGVFCNPVDVYEAVNFIINTPYLNGSSIDLNGGLI